MGRLRIWFEGDDVLMRQIEARARSGIDASLNLNETDPLEVLVVGFHFEEESTGRSLLGAEHESGIAAPLLPTAYGLTTIVDWLSDGEDLVEIEIPGYGNIARLTRHGADEVEVHSLERPDAVLTTALSDLRASVEAFLESVRQYVRGKAPSVFVDPRVPSWIQEKVLSGPGFQRPAGPPLSGRARLLALDHIRRRISSAPERLRVAAERVDLSEGTVELLGHEALAGAAERASSASEFEAGLRVSSAPGSSMARAAVQGYVGGEPERFLVLSDWKSREDASVRLSPIRVTSTEDDVWVIVDDALLDERYVQRALALWLDPFTGVAAMGKASRSIWEAGAPAKIVDEVLARIEAILAGAFDGEGYLLWRAKDAR